MIGTWMQQLAVGWLVYRMTHSAFWLGLVNFLTQIPNFILGLIAGVFVDRLDRLRVLKWTQALLGVQALILAILTLTGKLTLEQVLLLSMFQGIVNAIDMPTRQAFVVQMLEDRRHLGNAIALNSSVINGTRLVGPAIAGVMVVHFGEGVCFLFNAFSYLAVMIALYFMKVYSTPIHRSDESFFESMQSGLSYLFTSPVMRSVIIMLMVLSLVGTPFVTLFPAMADQVFHGGANVLSGLTIASGLGAFAAAFFLTHHSNSVSTSSGSPSIYSLVQRTAICSVVFAISLGTMGFVNSIWIGMPVLVVAGFGMMFQMSGSNIFIQTIVDDDKRGRLMGVFTLALTGVTPFGSLLMGGLADRLGLKQTFVICGSFYLLASLVFLFIINSYESEKYQKGFPSLS
jgi:MFS family permease